MTAVFGLDLSLTATGFAHPTGVGVIRSRGTREDTVGDRHERLVELRSRITDVLAATRARAGDLVVVEAPVHGQSGAGVWDRAGLWWLIVDRLAQLGFTVATVHPTRLKQYATGRGNADKGAMADAAARRIPNVITAGENNAVDALWLRAMGCEHLGKPLVQLPESQRAIVDKIDWPGVA